MLQKLGTQPTFRYHEFWLILHPSEALEFHSRGPKLQIDSRDSLPFVRLFYEILFLIYFPNISWIWRTHCYRTSLCLLASHCTVLDHLRSRELLPNSSPKCYWKMMKNASWYYIFWGNFAGFKDFTVGYDSSFQPELGISKPHQQWLWELHVHWELLSDTQPWLAEKWKIAYYSFDDFPIENLQFFVREFVRLENRRLQWGHCWPKSLWFLIQWSGLSEHLQEPLIFYGKNMEKPACFQSRFFP